MYFDSPSSVTPTKPEIGLLGTKYRRNLIIQYLNNVSVNKLLLNSPSCSVRPLTGTENAVPFPSV